MGNIEITKMQKLYLLHLLKNPEDNNITAVARAFSCSKPNSKYILDNMIIEGFLYKDKNSYKMTKIGRALVEELEVNRQGLELYLSQGLDIDRAYAYESSYKFLDQGLEGLEEIFVERAKLIEKFQEFEEIRAKDIEDGLGQGIYSGKLLIENVEGDMEQPSLKKSMAMLGFNEDIRLEIGASSHIIIEAKPIRKSMDGYSKSGKANQISYRENGKDKFLDYREGKFYIPLEILENWNLIGGTILETTILLNLDSIIGFGNHHQKKAAFTIFLDLNKL